MRGSRLFIQERSAIGARSVLLVVTRPSTILLTAGLLDGFSSGRDTEQDIHVAPSEQ
jgi:hypothetical protein